MRCGCGTWLAKSIYGVSVTKALIGVLGVKSNIYTVYLTECFVLLCQWNLHSSLEEPRIKDDLRLTKDKPSRQDMI
jgi:hypothetical protein